MHLRENLIRDLAEPPTRRNVGHPAECSINAKGSFQSRFGNFSRRVLQILRRDLTLIGSVPHETNPFAARTLAYEVFAPGHASDASPAPSFISLANQIRKGIAFQTDDC